MIKAYELDISYEYDLFNLETYKEKHIDRFTLGNYLDNIIVDFINVIGFEDELLKIKSFTAEDHLNLKSNYYNKVVNKEINDEEFLNKCFEYLINYINKYDIYLARDIDYEIEGDYLLDKISDIMYNSRKYNIEYVYLDDFLKYYIDKENNKKYLFEGDK